MSETNPDSQEINQTTENGDNESDQAEQGSRSREFSILISEGQENLKKYLAYRNGQPNSSEQYIVVFFIFGLMYLFKLFVDYLMRGEDDISQQGVSETTTEYSTETTTEALETSD